MFPEFASLKKLETKHPTYIELASFWAEIRDLRAGYSVLKNNRERYTPRRPQEPLELYRARLDKFVFTPVFGNVVREYVSKLVSAPIHVSDADDPFWTEFRDAIDGSSQDETDFLSSIFASLLYYGRAYVGVSLPKVNVNPRSAAEDPKINPYALVYDPLLVTQWGDDWYLTRKVYAIQQPLSEPTQMAEWIFWTSTHTATYSAEVRVTDGNITHVKSGDNWVTAWGDGAIIPLVSEVAHNCDRAPLQCLTVPSELWTGNAVAIKQIQYTWIENGYTDTAALAGIVQRLFKPSVIPQDDPRAILTPQTDSLKDLKTGNGYILVGDNFSFEESSGAALGNLQNVLDKIEGQIRDLVSKGYASASGQVAVSQSGVSKEMDQTQVQDAMRQYGKKVARFYQEILGIVAQLSRRSERPNVKGLDTYTTANLKNSIDQTAAMLPYWDKLPATTRSIWIGKLSALMTGSVSPEEESAILAELEVSQDNVSAIDLIKSTVDLQPIASQIPVTALKLWTEKLAIAMTGDREIDQIAIELDEIFSDDLSPDNPAHIQQVVNALKVDAQTARAILNGEVEGEAKSGTTGSP